MVESLKAGIYFFFVDELFVIFIFFGECYSNLSTPNL